jgi:SAM-dependent methyltransferase
MGTTKSETQRIAEAYADRGDPNGWFEEFYTKADGDIHKVYWADLEPNPMLIDWIEQHTVPTDTRAVAIGCGLGDDAEALAQYGYGVIAFDISPSAIAMCQKRYPDSTVDYRVADLFDYPADWHGKFDLVYECNTIQILSGPNRARAVKAIADLVAPGGEILVSCRSRVGDAKSGTFPLALDRNEINGFQRAGLDEIHFVSYNDKQDPPVPHYFAVFTRPA